MNPFPTEKHEFALCLTHDVDRPYKGLQSVFAAMTERDITHLRDLHPSVNPWWQFERIMELESSLDVRSAFYFLQEQHILRDRSPREWLSPTLWIEHLGRYDPGAPALADMIGRLDEHGWEVGLHGSLGTADDRDRLAMEKDYLEDLLGHAVTGCRQHHLRLSVPETWRQQADIGLSYDASLSSPSGVGFHHGYNPIQPLDDESFVVFPLTVMDKKLAAVSRDQEAAEKRIMDLLEEAREEHAVMTVLWHPRNFSNDYPGQRTLYRTLIEEALSMDAWVGPPAELYDMLDFNESRPSRSTVTTD